jgi:hypothetical protein
MSERISDIGDCPRRARSHSCSKLIEPANLVAVLLEVDVVPNLGLEDGIAEGFDYVVDRSELKALLLIRRAVHRGQEDERNVVGEGSSLSVLHTS